MFDLYESDYDHTKIDALVAYARENQIEAQQLALDASQLIAMTKERFDSYKDSGFFKRLRLRLSGELGSLERGNQQDLIKMQKYAWIYLKKLQEQNLLQEYAILTIRNNLQEVLEIAGENRAAIINLVDKFGDRLRHCEKNIDLLNGHVNLLKWRASIKIRGYEQYPELCRIIAVMFDYFRFIQDKNIDYNAVIGSDDVEVILNDISIDYNKKIVHSQFTEKLIDEIHQIGFTKYQQLLQLEIKKLDIDVSENFVLRNISSYFYPVLFRISLDTSRLENIRTREDKQQMIPIFSKYSQEAIYNHNISYSLLQIANEFLSGCMIVTTILARNIGSRYKYQTHSY
ncbi:hypothetical protein [Methylomicrobium album]|uniref:Uncharacterized protein n=1 Tax=Methylomicrobium album BG8 TaxID=686340 RepID=H8GGB1_METAL|nr:hypothetical protein [Methylomicrobium album]EIC31191.1 hypothetical protein Metal_3543 [Methylomicrobium album BG8]